MKNKILAILGSCILLIAGGWGIPLYQETTVMNKITKDAASFNAAVKEQPGILDNKTITRKRLHSTNPNRSDQVVLENITIRNLTFKESFFMQSIFRNVTFENCTFIRTDFSNSIFENVRFIGGTMYGYTKPKDSYNPYETIIGGTIKNSVIFSGITFGKSVNIKLKGGAIILRDCTATLNPDPDNDMLVWGENVNIRMDNCRVHNQWALNIRDGANSAYITNCEFKNAALRMSGGSVAWIENCRISGLLPATETVVVKNSRILHAGFDISAKGTRVFCVNNTFPKRSKLNEKLYLSVFGGTPKESAKSFFYFYSDEHVTIPGQVALQSGNLTFFNTSFFFDGLFSAVAELNLSNVDIHGGTLDEGMVFQSRWNNVNIYPIFDLMGKKFLNVEGYNVEYPKGNPWKNGEVKIGYNHEPLEIERPPVPTLEELGLAQFWAEHDVIIEKEQ